MSSVRAPCVRCGSLLHTGEGRIVVAFTVEEMAELAAQTTDRAVRDRLLCAIGLLDQDRDRAVRMEIG